MIATYYTFSVATLKKQRTAKQKYRRLIITLVFLESTATNNAFILPTHTQDTLSQNLNQIMFILKLHFTNFLSVFTSDKMSTTFKFNKVKSIKKVFDIDTPFLNLCPIKVIILRLIKIIKEERREDDRRNIKIVS